MGIDDQRHVVGAEAGRLDPVLEGGTPLAAPVLDGVDVVELGRLLVPRPRIQQHQPIVMLDEQASHPERNAVFLVGCDAPRPQRLGHHAEHRTAIQLLSARLNGVHAEPPDHAGVEQRSRIRILRKRVAHAM